MTVRRTLFLHVGLPQCGSSALQDWAETNRELLARQDILWPEVVPAGMEAARHQWLVAALKNGSNGRLESVLAAAPDDVLISSEGLSLQFDEFPRENLAWFREATADWNVRLVMMTRDVGAWQKAMWKQSMINPPESGTDYGLPLCAADFSGLPRIQRLTDMRRFSRDVQQGYGAADVTLIRAEGDWLSELGSLLDVNLDGATAPARRHESIPEALGEIVLAINADGQAGGPRDALLTLMQLALNTRSDTLRELVSRNGGAFDVDFSAVEAALARVSESSGDQPAIRIALEAMSDRLAEMRPELTEETSR